MARKPKSKVKPLPFGHKLVLNQWIVSLFGFDPLKAHKDGKRTLRPVQPLAVNIVENGGRNQFRRALAGGQLAAQPGGRYRHRHGSRDAAAGARRILHPQFLQIEDQTHEHGYSRLPPP